MKNLSLIPYYIPINTKLHHLGVNSKLVLILFYSVLILANKNSLSILMLILIFSLTYTTQRLPFASKGYVGLIASLLLISVFFEQWLHIYFVSFIHVLGKVASITLILGLFSMTTRINDLLQLLSGSRIIKNHITPIFYLINTTLAVFPSVQYDIQRAIDAEEVRIGKKIKLYSLRSLINITIIIIVRIINRSNRFTQTIIDRGYSLQTGLSPIQESIALRWQDFLFIFVCLVPGIAIFLTFEL
jgi:energy-coupling factor transporter transmembrane protein EcfT